MAGVLIRGSAPIAPAADFDVLSASYASVHTAIDAALSGPKPAGKTHDTGRFQPVSTFYDTAQKAIDIRENCERPFDLIKKREGLEQTRVRSQHGVVARSTFTTIAALLIEMAGTRQKKRRKDDKQMDLFKAAE
jgi:hypothetical protein